MKVLKKIGDFFAAMVPLFVMLGIQIIVGLLGIFAAAAVEMMKTGQLRETISKGSTVIIMVISYFICMAAAIFEFKVHRFHLNDISPVKQNVKVYIPAVFLSAGAFFVFRFISPVFYKVTGLTYTAISLSFADSTAVLIIIMVLEQAVLEEFVFRGMLLKTFEMRFPVWVGIIVSLFGFWLNHIDNDMFFALLYSALLVFIRYRFGDIKLCMLVNFVICILDIAIPISDGGIYETIINIGSAAGIVIAAAAMFLMMKFASKTEQVLENG